METTSRWVPPGCCSSWCRLLLLLLLLLLLCVSAVMRSCASPSQDEDGEEQPLLMTCSGDKSMSRSAAEKELLAYEDPTYWWAQLVDRHHDFCQGERHLRSMT